MVKIAILGGSTVLSYLYDGLSTYHNTMSIQLSESPNIVNMWKVIPLRNFHDITIELLEYSPDVIVYHPINDGDPETSQISYNELVIHLTDSLSMINPHYVFIIEKTAEPVLSTQIQDVLKDTKRLTLIYHEQFFFLEKVIRSIADREYGIFYV